MFDYINLGTLGGLYRTLQKYYLEFKEGKPKFKALHHYMRKSRDKNVKEGNLDHDGFTSEQHLGFEAAAWYWHFVDVVWLFLYISIYWWGSR